MLRAWLEDRFCFRSISILTSLSWLQLLQLPFFAAVRGDDASPGSTTKSIAVACLPEGQESFVTV